MVVHGKKELAQYLQRIKRFVGPPFSLRISDSLTDISNITFVAQEAAPRSQEKDKIHE